VLLCQCSNLIDCRWGILRTIVVFIIVEAIWFLQDHSSCWPLIYYLFTFDSIVTLRWVCHYLLIIVIISVMRCLVPLFCVICCSVFVIHCDTIALMIVIVVDLYCWNSTLTDGDVIPDWWYGIHLSDDTEWYITISLLCSVHCSVVDSIHIIHLYIVTYALLLSTDVWYCWYSITIYLSLLFVVVIVRYYCPLLTWWCCGIVILIGIQLLLLFYCWVLLLLLLLSILFYCGNHIVLKLFSSDCYSLLLMWVILFWLIPCIVWLCSRSDKYKQTLTNSWWLVHCSGY